MKGFLRQFFYNCIDYSYCLCRTYKYLYILLEYKPDKVERIRIYGNSSKGSKKAIQSR